MRQALRWLAKASVALMVAAALVFGTSQALARDVDGEYCMTEPWHLGFCPPYTTQTCNSACQPQYGGGSCEYYDNGWCCACME